MANCNPSISVTVSNITQVSKRIIANQAAAVPLISGSAYETISNNAYLNIGMHSIGYVKSDGNVLLRYSSKGQGYGNSLSMSSTTVSVLPSLPDDEGEVRNKMT